MRDCQKEKYIYLFAFKNKSKIVSVTWVELSRNKVINGIDVYGILLVKQISYY